ncbi:MAG: hypothetical protein DMF39_10690 [Verrucomicrobia bacterium]|nr:MAG: hypothetical protein DMF39_10690 [Verrucomicrobiota bacterium]
MIFVLRGIFFIFGFWVLFDMILFQQGNLGPQILVGFFRFWLEAIECMGGVRKVAKPQANWML